MLLLVVLSGCTNVKEQQFEADRSPYYPLAVTVANTTPEITSQSYSDDIARGTGTTICSKAIVVSFGYLAPLCILSIPLDIAPELEYEDRQKEFITKVQSLEPKLVKQTDQSLLLTHVMEYLHRYSANAYEINQETYSLNVEERSRILKEQGYPVTLELSLLSLDFSELEIVDAERKIMLCLTLEARGRTINNLDNQVIAIQSARRRQCKKLEEWLHAGEVEAVSSELYSSLSQYIVDELLFIFKQSDEYMTAPTPIRPKVLLDRIALEYKSDDEVDKNEVIEVQWDFGLNKPERLKDFRPISNVPFVFVSTTPSFEWSTIEGQGITDVKYDFRVFRGGINYFGISIRPKGFLGSSGSDYYPIGQYISPNELIHSRDDLISNTYVIDTCLDTCSWYLWTVRATFKLYGNPRVTNWSVIKNPDTGRSSLIPIRTPASEGSPGCWDKYVDWGAIKDKEYLRSLREYK